MEKTCESIGLLNGCLSRTSICHSCSSLSSAFVSISLRFVEGEFLNESRLWCLFVFTLQRLETDLAYWMDHARASDQGRQHHYDENSPIGPRDPSSYRHGADVNYDYYWLQSQTHNSRPLLVWMVKGFVSLTPAFSFREPVIVSYKPTLQLSICSDFWLFTPTTVTDSYLPLSLHISFNSGNDTQNLKKLLGGWMNKTDVLAFIFARLS